MGKRTRMAMSDSEDSDDELAEMMMKKTNLSRSLRKNPTRESQRRLQEEKRLQKELEEEEKRAKKLEQQKKKMEAALKKQEKKKKEDEFDEFISSFASAKFSIRHRSGRKMSKRRSGKRKSRKMSKRRSGKRSMRR